MKKIILALLILNLSAKAEDSLKTNDCNKIEACKNKDTMVAYSCLYHEMLNKVQYDGTSCKKLITEIGEKSFVPMFTDCKQYALTRCYLKADVDLYICLNKIKNDITPRCRNKIEAAHEKFAELVTEHFPENSTSQEKDRPSEKKNTPQHSSGR